MDIFINIFFWLTVGIILMLAEILIPGGIVVFLGIAAVSLSLALYLDLVSTWSGALMYWFISSIILLLSLRQFGQRWWGGDSSVENTEEYADAIGRVVLVSATIGPGDQLGRVAFEGSQWQAMSDGSIIEAGEHATIVAFENITLIVEKASLRDTMGLDL